MVGVAAADPDRDGGVRGAATSEREWGERAGRGQRAAPPALPAAAARCRAPVSLPEMVMRAAADSTNSLDGRSITLTGFTLHHGGGIDLGRVVIVCCAADAQLARIHLTGPGRRCGEGLSRGHLAADPWSDRAGLGAGGGRLHSDDVGDTVTRIDKPKNTYAY